jgi:putative membrane protein
MSVIRTSLSLIGFGFTIFQVFQKLYEAQILKRAQAARNFGSALVFLGSTTLILGIIYHVRFMAELRRQRELMREQNLIHGETQFPMSQTLIIALFLLAIGLMAMTSMIFSVGPFG